MAQFVRTIIDLVDDLDGSPGDETLEFCWDGRELVIDLSKANADKLRKCIAPYVGAARPRPKAKRAKGKPAKAVATEQVTNGAADEAKAQRDRMRQWGRDNGFEVSNFSKVPQVVVSAYEAAHQHSLNGAKTQ